MSLSASPLYPLRSRVTTRFETDLVDSLALPRSSACHKAPSSSPICSPSTIKNEYLQTKINVPFSVSSLPNRPIPQSKKVASKFFYSQFESKSNASNRNKFLIKVKSSGNEYFNSSQKDEPDVLSKGGSLVREVLTPNQRSKLDLSSDRDFYSLPRFAKHVDESFISTLTQLYRERLPEGGEIFDMMSSWISHLPPEVKYEKVVGHGMNALELARNPRLSYFFIRDLNQDPKFEIGDQSFDAVICALGIQYLQQPEKVFTEIYRILRPGGVIIMSFSNRMFYDKAITAWRDNSEHGRVLLVKQYFNSVSGFTEPEVVTQVQNDKTFDKPKVLAPLFDLISRAKSVFKSANHPFYAVVAYRNFKPIK